MEGEFDAVVGEFRELEAKFKDPLVIGTLLNRLAQDRESTNLLLREINAKLDRIETLEQRIAQLESGGNVGEKMLLPEVDEAIIAFVKKKGAVCADEVQSKFQYKGKNAASARLNRLCAANILKKTQVGKKVYFQKVK